MEKRGNLTSLIQWCLARGSESLSVIASISVILMMVQITADVALKYIFHKPIAGTIEIIAYYYMPAAIFFPLTFAERYRRHITVTLFTQRFAPRRIAVFDVFSGLVSTLYVSLLTWSSVTSAILHTRQGEELDATFFYVPIWPARWFLPVGAALFALYLLLHVVQDARVALGKAPPWQGGGEAKSE